MPEPVFLRLSTAFADYLLGSVRWHVTDKNDLLDSRGVELIFNVRSLLRELLVDVLEAQLDGLVTPSVVCLDRPEKLSEYLVTRVPL